MPFCCVLLAAQGINTCTHASKVQDMFLIPVVDFFGVLALPAGSLHDDIRRCTGPDTKLNSED